MAASYTAASADRKIGV